MKIDRELQHALLTRAVQAYPAEAIPDVDGLGPLDAHHVAGQLFYLAEHGLVKSFTQMTLDNRVSFGPYKATKAGIDFLADDGGLSAVLGVVTIKLHQDDLKALIERRIEEQPLPQPDKSRWLAALRALPAETTKHLALKLMDAGLAHAPGAMHTLGTFLGIAP